MDLEACAARVCCGIRDQFAEGVLQQPRIAENSGCGLHLEDEFHPLVVQQGLMQLGGRIERVANGYLMRFQVVLDGLQRVHDGVDRGGNPFCEVVADRLLV